MGIKAIITAGGGLPRDLKHLGYSKKALIPLNGSTLLDCALTAADGCHYIDDVVVIGDEEVKAAVNGRVSFVKEGETAVENVHRGFKNLGGESNDYLIFSPDLPFVTATAVTDFLDIALKDGEIVAPIVTKNEFLADYPDAPNLFEKLRGGKMITLGSCIYMTGHALKTNIPLFRDLFNSRKHPHRMAIMLGLPLALAFVFKQMTIEMVEQRLSQLTGVGVRAIEIGHGCLAYDIDTKENYEFALKLTGRG